MIEVHRFLNKIFVQFFFMIAGCSIILAQEAELPNRSIEPIITEETLPNEVDEWDLRLSFDYLQNDEETNVTLPQAQLFFGILENLSGEISIPLDYKKSEVVVYGLGSISTSLKWLIINQSTTVPAVVLGFEAGFPTNSFSEKTEERAYELSPYIAWLKDFGQLGVQGNIGRLVELPISGGEKEYRTEFNIAFSYPLFGEKVDAIAELHSSLHAIGQNELSVAPGIKYYLNDEHFFALAMPVDLHTRNSVSRIILQYQFQL